MRSLVEFLVQIVVALTGALGSAILVVGGAAVLGGCALLGSGWCVKKWRGRGGR